MSEDTNRQLDRFTERTIDSMNNHSKQYFEKVIADAIEIVASLLAFLLMKSGETIFKIVFIVFAVFRLFDGVKHYNNLNKDGVYGKREVTGWILLFLTIGFLLAVLIIRRFGT